MCTSLCQERLVRGWRAATLWQPVLDTALHVTTRAVNENWARKANSLSLFHQQTFTEHLLWASHNFRAVGKTDKNLSPLGLIFQSWFFVFVCFVVVVFVLNKGISSLVFTKEMTSKTLSHTLTHVDASALTCPLFLPTLGPKPVPCPCVYPGAHVDHQPRHKAQPQAGQEQLHQGISLEAKLAGGGATWEPISEKVLQKQSCPRTKRSYYSILIPF